MQIIGVAGGSASGKTTFAQLLKERLGNAVVISVDSYYKSLPILEMEKGDLDKPDFDNPKSIEHSLLLKHLQSLKGGTAVDCPCYDFVTSLRMDKTERILPVSYVIVEGIFSFFWPDLRNIFDCKVFIDASDEIRFARRLERDVQERGRTREYVIDQWTNCVRPNYEKFCAPLRDYADYVISGELPIQEMIESFQSMQSC